jgi:hypothetical protein
MYHEVVALKSLPSTEQGFEFIKFDFPRAIGVDSVQQLFNVDGEAEIYNLCETTKGQWGA